MFLRFLLLYISKVLKIVQCISYFFCLLECGEKEYLSYWTMQRCDPSYGYSSKRMVAVRPKENEHYFSWYVITEFSK